jgi:hypothetical protein
MIIKNDKWQHVSGNKVIASSDNTPDLQDHIKALRNKGF